MTVKINGKTFDFDSEEKYPGERPPFRFSNVAPAVVILGGIFLCIFWFNDGWIFLFKFFQWLVPSWMAGIHV